MGQHVAARRPPRRRHLIPTSVLALAVVIAGIAVVSSGTPGGRRPRPAAPAAALSRAPSAAVTEVPSSPAAAAASLATSLLRRAPVIVVAGPATAAGVTAAAATARRVHAPLLLAPAAGSATDRAAVRAAVTSLHPAAVLAAGLPARTLSAELPGVRVTGSAGQLPRTAAPAPLSRVAVLVDTAAAATPPALSAAAGATAALAGATVVPVTGADPRADPAAISALHAAQPQSVVAVGAGLGSVSLLSQRLAVAETGTQLPGGGQVLFPGRELVALYGSPGSPSLGVLGHQGLPQTIALAKTTAAQYDKLAGGVPVVPSLEIIATVATAGAGASGDYSAVISPSVIKPWVEAAAKAGEYVTLDLQPGRANFLDQAKIYASLLELPNVGLALDPEWKLTASQVPLRQIGSVPISEVNSVATWLSALTAAHHLPQKLLELHEFQLSMLPGLNDLDTRYDNLAMVVNMDGQGAPQTKQQTWDTVTAAAPRGVFFGWKDFYVKDTPMLAPEPTIRRTPVPVLISYQ